MELSKRLTAVANLVTKGNTVADIGCDHGYVSIYLVKNKIAPKVLAMDVRTGPLERAKAHIRKYGYEEYIETRLSNGLEHIEPYEAQTLICAGMGGRLICYILEAGCSKLTGVEECILQPRSEIQLVRKYLREHGFTITKEEMILECGKFYPILHTVYSAYRYTGKALEEQELFDSYGGFLLQQKDKVLYEYLQGKQIKCTEILIRLREKPQVTIAGERRIAEIEKELIQIKEAFLYYDV